MLAKWLEVSVPSNPIKIAPSVIFSSLFPPVKMKKSAKLSNGSMHAKISVGVKYEFLYELY